MIKHSTATVYVLHRFADSGWKVGLIEHPLWGKWVPAGGHVEQDENAAEAALREAAEETGLRGFRLISPYSPALPPDFPLGGHDDYSGHVPVPWWIVEFEVTRDRSMDQRHRHVDHQFVAIVDDPQPITGGEHPFGWYSTDELATIAAFTDVHATATHLLDLVSEQVNAWMPTMSPSAE